MGAKPWCLALTLAYAALPSGGGGGYVAGHTCQPLLLLPLRLRGGGRRRVARPVSRMRLGHLGKVVEKRASNIARRQQKEARDNAHMGKADGVWEIMNPEELKVIRKEEKARLREAKRRMARKMVQGTGPEVSSESVDGQKVIVDFADVDRAKRELAAAAELDSDHEEDAVADFVTPARAATSGAGTAIAAAAAAGLTDGTAESAGDASHPPEGALVYPTGSQMPLREALGKLRENQTIWLEAGRHAWTPKRKSAKDKGIEFEEQRMRSLTDWEYEPLDDRVAGAATFHVDTCTNTYTA